MCARITRGPHGNWMYTGYFDNCTKYKEFGLVPVSIAIRTPPCILDLRYPKLAVKSFCTRLCPPKVLIAPIILPLVGLSTF